MSAAFTTSCAIESRVMESRQPRKKALLIGIVYKDSEGEPLLKLRGPHKDVFQLKELLIGMYYQGSSASLDSLTLSHRPLRL